MGGGVGQEGPAATLPVQVFYWGRVCARWVLLLVSLHGVSAGGQALGDSALEASLHLLLLPCTAVSAYRVLCLCRPFFFAVLADGVEYACTLHFAVMHILDALFILFLGGAHNFLHLFTVFQPHGRGQSSQQGEPIPPGRSSPARPGTNPSSEV